MTALARAQSRQSVALIGTATCGCNKCCVGSALKERSGKGKCATRRLRQPRRDKATTRPESARDLQRRVTNGPAEERFPRAQPFRARLCATVTGMRRVAVATFACTASHRPAHLAGWTWAHASASARRPANSSCADALAAAQANAHWMAACMHVN